MNKYHQELLKNIQNASKTKYKYQSSEKYLGTKRTYYGLNTATKGEVLKKFKKTQAELTFKEYVDLLNSLYKGDSFDEKTAAGSLLWFYPEHRKNLDPKLLDKWLEELEGWAEIDCTCQSSFTAEEMLDSWQIWKKLLTEFAASKNISKRRASLVLLTQAVRQTVDERLSKLAFENIEKVKHEKDILITKAISWLLRSMVKNYKNEVKEYLYENKDSLPKIAVRETTRKIETGKKS